MPRLATYLEEKTGIRLSGEQVWRILIKNRSWKITETERYNIQTR
ncbi:hypothetical protein H6F85_21025 [Microcoleus sp. FACHB-45]|nr:hypothetical protein [Microcoleus sp. FACHB-84]MBD2011146.1 hypothetical protein [Microcoleus sp. FACHB-45]